MNRTHIIIGLLICLVIIYFLNNEKRENLDNPSLSNEAIQNIASVYANTAGEAIFNKIRSTGGITGDVTGNVTGNLKGDVTGNLKGDVTANNITSSDIKTNTLSSTGSIIFNGDLKTSNSSKFTINGIDIRDNGIGCSLSSINTKDNYYNVGMNAYQFIFPIGKYTLNSDRDYINDTADSVIVYPGYGVKLYTNYGLKADSGNSNEFCLIQNNDIKPARIALHNNPPTLDLNDTTDQELKTDIYTHNKDLVKITYNGTQSLLNSISSLHVFKL